MHSDPRHAITEKVLTQLPQDQRIELSRALSSWWRDFRFDRGLRLTIAGRDAFVSAQIENWNFDLTNKFVISAHNLLIMDKKLTCPYFLHLGKRPKIVLFGSEAAMMLALYQDPQRWVAFLQQT